MLYSSQTSNVAQSFEVFSTSTRPHARIPSPPETLTAVSFLHGCLSATLLATHQSLSLPEPPKLVEAHHTQLGKVHTVQDLDDMDEESLKKLHLSTVTR